MRQRVITAVILLGIVLGALFLDPTPSHAIGLGLCLVVVGVASWEMGRLTESKQSAVLALIASGVAATLHFLNLHPGVFATAMLGFAVATILLARRGRPTHVVTSTTAAMYVICTGLALAKLIVLKTSFPGESLLFVAIPIWAGDTAAMLAGRAIGKHKLAPTISPNKTYEGAAANFVIAATTGTLLGHFMFQNWTLGLGIGCSAGLLGQCGDLFESWLKRRIDLKDSSHLLPGHGGVLDRIDSLLATAPIALLIITVSTHPNA